MLYWLFPPRWEEFGGARREKEDILLLGEGWGNPKHSELALG